MVRISIQEYERDPLGYLRRAENGETLQILRGDLAVAEIKPLETKRKTPRPIGIAKGEFVVADDFDAPLPEDIIKDFEGR